MKAVRFVGAGRPAQVVDIPTPIPGPGEILVKIAGDQSVVDFAAVNDATNALTVFEFSED